MKASKYHAYVTKKTNVVNSKKKKVGVLGKGIVFSYDKLKSGYVRFNYFGHKRYVKASSLVTNSRIRQFVKANPTKFEVRLRTTRPTSVTTKRGRGKTLKILGTGDTVQSFGTYGNYYKVLINERFGYVCRWDCKNYCMVDVMEFPAIAGSSKRQKIVNYAKKFIGNPYVWGGTSLTNGTDCSGFVQSVYKAFGYNLPRCSYEQARIGKRVKFSQLKPGDLIFYRRGGRIGHVTMYAGNGMCVQARGRAYGIVMTRYDYSEPAWAQRIL